jgi:hypothetical protein
VKPVLTRAVQFAFAVTLLGGQTKPDALIGRWRSTDVSPTGFSAIFEFHPGNQLDFYASVVSEEKYRIVGTDTILLRSADGHEVKRELEWDNPDRARIDDEAAGKSIELTRVGTKSDRQNPLTGEWSTTREWKGKSYPARALFFTDGRVLWIIDIRAEHGRYSVDKQVIRIEIPSRPLLVGTLKLDGDRLKLPNPKGGQSTFERF